MIRRLDRQVWLVEALRSSARVGGRKRTEGRGGWETRGVIQKSRLPTGFNTD